MFGRFNRRFAYQYQGGDRDWEGWTPPWLRDPEHRHGPWHGHGPHVFRARMRHGFFGPGGPFGPQGPFGPGGPGGPGKRGPRFFGRGDLKYALLKLLQERSMHGYEMMKALEERSDGFYTPSAGSIYPTLQMLEDRGFVTVAEAEGKKVYSITDAGRSFLNERQKEEEGFQGPPPRPWEQFGRRWQEPEVQALRSEAMEVARLFAIAGRSAFNDPQKLAQLHTIIEHTRKELSDLIYSSGEKPAEEPTPPTDQA